jgi:hypothetical protein
MKTQKVLSMLDQQKRQLNQINSLSNMLVNVPTLFDNDLHGCMSILFDLSDDLKASHEIITQSFIPLGIVNDCVNGLE